MRSYSSVSRNLSDEQPEPDRPAVRSGLLGQRLPDIEFQSGQDAWLKLSALAAEWLVLFFYPGRERQVDAGGEGRRVVEGETVERALEWKRCNYEIESLGCEIVGVSSQSTIRQEQFGAEELLPFRLLSDPDFEFATTLGLPTTGPDWARAYDPQTLVTRHGRVEQLFFPVSVAGEAKTVLGWLREHS